MMKIAIPALLGLLVATAVVGGFVLEIMNLSWRTDGTMFSKYATHYPVAKNPAPTEAFYCNPAYKARWAGCNIK